MKIVFRVDASLQIGTGHVMRCITLAGTMVARGVECEFICREHPGNLIDFIQRKGFTAHSLPLLTSQEPSADATVTKPSHWPWLGATQHQDAEACAPILAESVPNWLIVDHYALDAYWEITLASHCRKLMVIDDLADRPHKCNILLDQTFGRDAADYRSLVPAESQLLCGSKYALLRPDFAILRPYSLQRRTLPALRELLITMGGVDKGNATGLVLQALPSCPLPVDCRITVVMGATAPWLDEVHKLAQDLPWPSRVLVGVSDIAQFMADSDLAIGAAGATSWERCCLGLPTIMLILADNQVEVGRNLAQAGAAITIDTTREFVRQLPALIASLAEQPAVLMAMSRSAMDIVDGHGSIRVAEILER